jgi:2-polyprenyl-6-methoxyphenol hydroxylase-like FAD-dependent oxidoreductase
MSKTSRGKVLVSGASIAGPALAYWLHQYGFDVTVVEKAGALRSGGYPIDLRGPAVDVAEQMGILPQLRAAHVDTRQLTFLNPDGSTIARLNPNSLMHGNDGRDLEIRRGDLGDVLYAATRDGVAYRFNDSISGLGQDDDGVDVTFGGGDRQRFDLVVGADGLHSRTRELTFGAEEQFHHYIGYCFAGFSLPNTFGLSHEAVLWSKPGKAAALYAVRDYPEVTGLLNFARPEPPYSAFRNPEAQRELVAEVFAGEGWEIPGLVDAMRSADDLFFDVVSQIRMPNWSSGRVALVGDAAHAPSFLTGQGSSLAMVGAYLLAHALATHEDHAAAFAAYEDSARGFVELNQNLVGEGDATLFPATDEAMVARNEMLRRLSELPPGELRPEHYAITLPDIVSRVDSH